MSRSMQWLSLIGGILILGYGIFRLLAQPQPDWVPMILGLLIVAFSVSKMVKSRDGKEKQDGRSDPDVHPDPSGTRNGVSSIVGRRWSTARKDRQKDNPLDAAGQII